MAHIPDNSLHLVLTAGEGAFDACRKLCKAGDSVVFLDDGVRQLILGEPGKKLPPGVAVFYSMPDLEARGLASAAEQAHVRTLGDSDFIGLLSQHLHCLSWK